MPIASNIWTLEAGYVRGSEKWRNSHDIKFVGVGVGDPPAPDHAIVLSFTDWSQGQGFEGTFLETVTLRPIVYNEPLGGEEHPPIWQNIPHLVVDGETRYNGSHAGDPALPKDVTVFVKRTTQGGRPGKLFIRTLLYEGDVESIVAGAWQFSPGGTRFTAARFHTTVVENLSAWFQGGISATDYAFAVVHGKKRKPPNQANPPTSTIVTDYIAIRPTWNDSRR